MLTHPRGPAGIVLGVGIATVDIIHEVAAYPAEDDEIRALAEDRRRGGNVANSLVILSQLGRRCRWVGTLADDAGADLILADLARFGVDTSAAVRVQAATTPTSFVLSSRASGSRTIVHYRDLPELDAESFDRVSLADLAWVHFEGRHPDATRRMIERVMHEAPGLPISLELEKPRTGIEDLLRGPRILMASRPFAIAQGFDEAEPFLVALAERSDATLITLTWGARGAYFLDRGGSIGRVPATPPSQVVDTLGAGDVFNAGLIDGLLRGLSAPAAVEAAVRLAGRKCAHRGLVVRPDAEDAGTD
ncbi:PfkB family carbohydrate kinase [Thioalkalicoccus limnaeus]|uniref:PfkB family carbohydrate kinase n=1 Tax=Thioalkalicoccus limnaeus TaxID=120681 RepID=A0ABV4BA93_9GAMM